jgi:hypothetical protein
MAASAPRKTSPYNTGALGQMARWIHTIKSDNPRGLVCHNAGIGVHMYPRAESANHCERAES